MILIDGYPIDLAITETHSLKNEVTKRPVEKGADITDHIRVLPDEISFEGVVSDTPIGKVALDPTRQAPSGSQLPSMDAYSRLKAIRDNKQQVTIQCSLGKLDSMSIVELSIPRKANNTKSLHFTVSFQHVTIVQNSRTTVKASIPNGGPGANLGAREALFKYLGGNVRWVKSVATQAENTTVNPDGTFHGGGFHHPVRSALYGVPILSTTHEERILDNGFDPFGNTWVDHYDLGRGDQETDKIMLQADGYVVLHDTGPHPPAGIKANVTRGYYMLNSGYPGVQGISSTPNPNGPDWGRNLIKDSSGKPVTRTPPSPSAWDSLLKNNQ